ncbi:MAG TPA: O-antigen ligase family protein [Solirubrobacteraceae bacterium]|nr:O-antigen ligase family protein [Solirubrobacteraceae bacterium]
MSARRARRSLCLAGAAAVLAGPTALAFWSGGYFDEPRLWAGLAACALVGLGALVAPLPRAAWTWPAVGALAALAGWVWLSASWAPLPGQAIADAQRVALYAAGLLAAVLLLGAAPRAVEPSLALGAAVVTGYALAARLLPGLVDQTPSRTALGRLEQPLTYWNASGALAALGVLLCARLAGDESRPHGVRITAAAGAVPLGLAVTLSFSRGALAALGAGLGVLCLLAPERAQLWAVGRAVVCGALAGAVGIELDGVRALAGSDGHRETQGLVMLGLLAVLMGGAALHAARVVPAGRFRRPSLGVLAGASVVLLVAMALAVTGRGVSSATPAGATPARLASAESNRYAYWRVALDMFAQHPLRGAGSGAFRVHWRRERKIADPARDAHSLYLETAAELGLVGLALLGLFAAGLAGAARAAWRTAPAAAAGPAAGLVLWALHTGIDWDWEMPALTLVALVLAGLLCTLSAPWARSGSAP